MKLELKHLAPYLPYGLEMSRNGFVGKLIQLKNPKETDLLEIFEFQISCSNWWENTEDVNHYKPILRPLSDLTKEIEVNGERFVLSDRLYYDFDRHGLNGFDFRDIEKTPLEYPFNIVQKLFEWHFDVFGLIEQGLAIDINKLKSTT